jgi:hypothetical protein
VGDGFHLARLVGGRLAGRSFNMTKAVTHRGAYAVRLERDSVCAADDLTAPNAMYLSVATTTSLSDAMNLINDMDYLPRIAGGKATWVAMTNRPLAVIAQEWAEPRFLVGFETPLGDLVAKDGIIFFRYFEQNPPEDVFRAHCSGLSSSSPFIL